MFLYLLLLRVRKLEHWNRTNPLLFTPFCIQIWIIHQIFFSPCASKVSKFKFSVCWCRLAFTSIHLHFPTTSWNDWNQFNRFVKNIFLHLIEWKATPTSLLIELTTKLSWQTFSREFPTLSVILIFWKNLFSKILSLFC